MGMVIVSNGLPTKLLLTYKLYVASKQIHLARAILTSISYDEVMDAVVRIWVTSLQSENWSVWRSVELNHRLHW